MLCYRDRCDDKATFKCPTCRPQLFMCGDHAILHAKDLKNHNVVKLELQTTIEESRLQVKQFKKNLISEMVNETQKIIIALKEASSKAVSDFKKNNKNVDQVKPFQFDKKRISFIIDQVKMIGEVYKINKDFQRPKVKTSVHPNLILIEELRKSIDELQAKIIKLEDEKKILTQQHQLEMKQETDRANELESKLKELKGKFNNKGNQFRKNPKALKGEIKSLKNQQLQSEKKIEELQVIVNRNSLIPSASQLIINRIKPKTKHEKIGFIITNFARNAETTCKWFKELLFSSDGKYTFYCKEYSGYF